MWFPEARLVPGPSLSESGKSDSQMALRMVLLQLRDASSGTQNDDGNDSDDNALAAGGEEPGSLNIDCAQGSSVHSSIQMPESCGPT